jgi:guanine deaminase
MIEPAELMRQAIAKCRQGIAAGQSPFGCAVAIGDRVVAVAHNTVLLTLDVTAHAEVNALRVACKARGDIHLPGAIVATTCEPCPMCTAALHWARVDEVYYGATIADAQAAGFNEMQLPAAEIARMGRSQIKLLPGMLAEECRELFAEWKRTTNPRAY